MQNNLTQIKIPATYMRGGTSKGTFFRIEDLPKEAQSKGKYRDNLLLRVVGSPDPYGKHIDGMGGATSSTSKVVLIEKSLSNNHDVNYYFGQVSVDEPFIDWSGNCGNLSSAVGPFAIKSGYIDNLLTNGIQTVRIWQANIKKTILAHIEMQNGKVKETGDFWIDGVAFSGSEIVLEFVEPIDRNEELFPTGNLVDELNVPNIGTFKTTMINAGIPTIFLNAKDLGYSGIELQPDINSDKSALEMFETIRAYGAMKMGLIKKLDEAKMRAHTPKIAFVAPPKEYITSSRKTVFANEIDLNVRALSMGQLHHAMMGTVSVAIGVAGCIEGTLVNIASGGGEKNSITFGHPSGTLKVGAKIIYENGKIFVQKVSMSRSARILMDGNVYIPRQTIK